MTDDDLRTRIIGWFKVRKARRSSWLYCYVCHHDLNGDDKSFLCEFNNMWHYRCANCGQQSAFSLDYPIPVLVPMTDTLRTRIAAVRMSPIGRPPMSDDGDTFTFDEMRISLTAFALWLSHCGYSMDEVGEGKEVELVDRFISETTSDQEATDD